MNSVDENKEAGKAGLRGWMRYGLIVKGIIYFTIGILALGAVLNLGGETTDSEGALLNIAAGPFGKTVLGGLSVGLVGLTLWYLFRGVRDMNHEGSDLKGLLRRLVAIGVGIYYGFLALFAIGLVLGAGSDSRTSISEWTRMVMGYEVGRWLIGLFGIGVIGVGIIQFFRAYKANFLEDLQQDEMSRGILKLGGWAGRFGMTARGVVIVVIGALLVTAAWQYDPEEAGGVGEALYALWEQPYGDWVLGLVAVGLIVYGLFVGLFLARYWRMDVG